MINYLARLGWSHGDDELFSREQLVQWFDGHHLAKSPAQWDAAKLNWVNAHYIKQMDDAELARRMVPVLAARGLPEAAHELLVGLCALFKDRCATLVELADWMSIYFVPAAPSQADLDTHVTEAVRPAVATLRDKLAALPTWDKASIAAAIKETLAAHGLKMPQLAHAVRVLVCGRAQTPSLDAVLALFSQKELLNRLRDA
jgi:glutamyl-tRNA synthetase